MQEHDGSTQPDARRFKTNSLFASETRSESAHDDQSGGTDLALSDGEIYGLLKSPRRRFVLWYLQTVDKSVSLGELAEQTAAWENDQDVVDVSSTERKRAYVALYQCHLPKLDEIDVLEFDQDRKRVSAGPNYETLARATLSTNDRQSGTDSFAPYYLLLAVASFLLVSGSVFVSSSFDAASTLLVLAVVGSFGVLATWDYVRTSDDPRSRIRTKLDALR